MTMVVTAIAIAAVIAVVIVVAIGITECATCTATDCRADQAASTTSYLAADNLATGCPKATADSGFSATALIRANRATRCPADTGTNGCTGTTAYLLTDHRAEYATQCAANTGRRIARQGSGAGQGKRKQKQVFHEGSPSQEDGADAASATGGGKCGMHALRGGSRVVQKMAQPGNCPARVQ